MSADNMKEEPDSGTEDEMRIEYDLSTLGKGVTGKYYERPFGGTNPVLIEPLG